MRQYIGWSMEEFYIFEGERILVVSRYCLPHAVIDWMLESRLYTLHFKNWRTLDLISAINITKSTSSGTLFTKILWASATNAIFARSTRPESRSLKASQYQYHFQRYLSRLLPWTLLVHYKVTRYVTLFLLFLITLVAISTCFPFSRISILKKLPKSSLIKYL
jgi:hypothetical protein